MKMSKIDKQLKYFVKALLKYAEKEDQHFGPDFTTEQIPIIFKGWTELEFNKVHHDAGKGCCIFMGPDRYSINVAHCNELRGEFTDNNRTKWRLIISAILLVLAIIGLLLNIYSNHAQNNDEPKQKPKITGHVEPPKK